MKNFLKYTLASIVGFLIANLILFFIFIGIIASVVASSKDKTVKVKPKTVLHIKLDKPIVDRASNNPLDNFNFGDIESSYKLGLYDVLQNIEKAKTDENIKGIYLELFVIPAGIATIDEIRNALIDFKESGKFIISYSDYYTQSAYYLASVADKVYLNPEGTFDFKGLRAEIMFIKGSLKKLGIEPQIIRHGKYKAAVEPFILDKMSDANREQTSKYVNSIWEHYIKGISTQRDISTDKLSEYADNYKLIVSEDLIDKKLIDGLKYKDEVLAELRDLLEIDAKKEINSISLNKYTKAPKKHKQKGLAKDKVAVIFAQGLIQMGKGKEDVIGSERISKAIREARLDSTIKAIVLRINSGGGSALASDIILREIILAKQVKPVIASMGNVAASGGYYIACAADTIVASDVTITGSIGVLGIIPNAKELLNDKLGITFDGVKTNKFSDFIGIDRPMRPEEKEIILEMIENVYDVFITHVSNGRNMTKEAIDEIGQGRVWSGTDAKEIGLIDVFGGLNKSIEIAVEKAGLEKYRVVSLPKQEDPFEQIMKQLTGDVKTAILKEQLGAQYKYYEKIQKFSKIKGIQAIMPYEIDVY
ncbi:MAG: signal peptide peptidase SppA [Bacteroidales bacterium]|nr:signal peptide peptidase SppA [Bacteroidales bacterium]